MSAFSVLAMYSICHADYFRSWDDGRDKNKIVFFFILGTKSNENKFYKVKWELLENVMWFLPLKKKASFTCENLQIFRQIRITSSKLSLKNK